MSTVFFTNKYEKTIYKQLNEFLDLKKPQIYFPILKKTGKNTKKSMLNNFYKIYSINAKVNRTAFDLRHFNNCKVDVTLQTNCNIPEKKFKKEKIFTKAVLLINPLMFIMGKYDNDHTRLLPSRVRPKLNWILQRKIMSPNNEAYIGAFLSYLLGKFRERNECIHFPQFYGTFNGIREKYYYDISVEFSGIKNKSWFKNALNSDFKVYSLDGDFPVPLEKICEDDTTTEYVLELSNVPVQITCSELLENTLDSYLKYVSTEKEVLAILFQIIFAMAFAQERIQLCHNDLHSSNIMYEKTTIKYLYYKIDQHYFKVPTYGKILKIIDFERATYTWNKQIFFSEVFDNEGDATGQYTFLPYHNINTVDKLDSLSNEKKTSFLLPNLSFDLCRLATTIISDIPSNYQNVQSLLKKWMTDDQMKDIRRFSEFKLYKKIASDIKNAVPKMQFEDIIFSDFLLEKCEIPLNVMIYKLLV